MRRKQGVKNLGKSISCGVAGRDVRGMKGERERDRGRERWEKKKQR